MPFVDILPTTSFVTTTALVLVGLASFTFLQRWYQPKSFFNLLLRKANIFRYISSTKTLWQAQLQQIKPILEYVLPVTREEKQYVCLLLIAIGVSLGVGRAIRIVQPLLIRKILESIDVSTAEHKQDFPWLPVASYVFIRFFLLSFLHWVTWILSKRFDHFVTERVNVASYNKIMSLSADYQDNKRTTTAWTTVKTSGKTVTSWVNMLIFELVPDVADMFFSISSFGATIGNAKMSLIILVVLICYSVAVVKTSSRSDADRKAWKEVWESPSKHSSQTIFNWWTVSLFGQINREQQQFKEKVEFYRNFDIKYCDQFWFNHNLKNVINGAGLLWIWLTMTREIWDGTRNKNDLVMFTYIWAELTRPIERILKWDDGLSQLVDETERILEILNKTPTIQEEPGAVEYEPGKGDVTFRNVSFTYKASDTGKNHGIHNVSFVIPRGSTVAIVGRSGGGKSTLLKLVRRFYDVDEGQISIGGHNVKHLKLASLAAGIAFVPQNIGAFSTTLLNNVRYPRPNATDEECRAACAVVGLEEMMNDDIGDNGNKLSGGQLQRLAIARVLVQQPDVLLLDEATSHLDSETENSIQQHLEEWQRQKEGRTIIMIAHSFRSIMNRDKCYIIAMKDGRVVEQGTEADLLSRKGYYHELYSQQVLG